MITHCERVKKIYDAYVKNWKAEHNEGEPACYEEWFENEYVCGYATEHNRTGKNKRPNDFYTKEFVCGKSSVARRDFEEMPVSMDTYDFDDETMQAIVDSVEANMVKEFGKDYDLYDDDIQSYWWSELEGFALHYGMNYYEDYDEDIEE